MRMVMEVIVMMVMVVIMVMVMVAMVILISMTIAMVRTEVVFFATAMMTIRATTITGMHVIVDVDRDGGRDSVDNHGWMCIVTP